FGISISQCQQVHFVDCSFQHTINTLVLLSASDAVFERCTLHGGQTGVGVDVHGGRVQLVNCLIDSGFGFSPPPAPAVRLFQCDVRVLGGHLSSGFGNGPFSPAYAIDGTGTLRIDPSTVLQGYMVPQPVSPTLSPQFVAMPIVEASYSSAPPAATTATLRPPAGWFGALYLGFPVPPAALPGFADEAWIDPATAVGPA